MEKTFKQPSVMSTQAHFAQAPIANTERSTFDRSHAYKTTFDAGLLIPIFCDEVLPGDTFDLRQTAFARLATPLKPIMDNIYLDTHFFFVPYRLVWAHWQQFCGEQRSLDDNPNDYSIPQVLFQLDSINGTLADYFGIPSRIGNTNSVSVSALPFRAYCLIWNDWYRDENLQEFYVWSDQDGPDNFTGVTPFRRGKRKDYFTSALPWPQKGDEVLIPLGVSAPVRGLGQLSTASSFTPNVQVHETGGVNDTYALSLNTSTIAQPAFLEQDPANPGYPLVWADLAEATAVSINDLRTAFQIQKLLERDARGGTRYIELILSHFGVQSDDARLQRPEYLGGNSTPVNVSPVAATFAAGEVAQGQLAGIGTGVNSSGFKKSFTEHGIIIGLVSARADLTYQQGIERFWSRTTRLDFYWPALSHLGEQAILNKEIVAVGAAGDDEVFGYQERYAEYRYKPSRITGKFKSDDPESLDVWHLCQDFASLPPLNASFIEDNPPIDRIIAVQDEPHFLLDVWFKLRCTRPMPVFAVPGLVDHF